MLEVYIGPNGFGKTTKLRNIKNDLINNGVDENKILFLESEILLMDEVKDTKDNTKTMEYILTELLVSQNIVEAKSSFEIAVDNVINSNVENLNNMIDEILCYNGQRRTVNFLNASEEKEYKKLVKINSNDIKNKMGSGQRMQLILGLIKTSNSKTHIFLDEPEKYSHPSMLNKTAKLIEEIAETKNVYIATHSPKLLSMINLDLDKIYIINDESHAVKKIDYENITSELSRINTNNFPYKCRTYYNAEQLKTNIKELHYREFIESLFTKKIYVCEGDKDAIFIKKLLVSKNLYNEDYVIFPTYGKYHMLVFAEIFRNLNIDFQMFYDKDNEEYPQNVIINSELSNYNNYQFDDELETEIGYTGPKNDMVKFIEFLDDFNFDSINYLHINED